MGVLAGAATWAAVGVGTVVVVGGTAVVGTGVVVGAGYGGYRLRKSRKNANRKKAMKKIPKWQAKFLKKHPELQICMFPEIDEDVEKAIPLNDVNADLFACVYDKDGNLLAIISGYDGKTEFENSSIVHSGDCRKGGLESRDVNEANESIVFNFKQLPEEADSIVIGIICDREEGQYLGNALTSSYINGFPIFKFMSVEVYENNKEVIESSINLKKEKIGDEKEEEVEKKEEPQPSDDD